MSAPTPEQTLEGQPTKARGDSNQRTTLLNERDAEGEKTCPTCGFTITPDQVKRVGLERIECPKCGEKEGANDGGDC